MIYIRAGLYAEGRTDSEFLLPIINRLLDDIAARLFSGAYELAETLGIDAPSGTSGGRAKESNRQFSAMLIRAISLSFTLMGRAIRRVFVSLK